MNAFDLASDRAGFSLAARASWEEPQTALFGASGSGKSTILEAIAGVRSDVMGTVRLRDRQIEALPARERRLGWVPQDAALFPHLTVRANLAFASAARGTDPGAVAKAIDALEIGPLLEQRAATLSGGERQRVAIARALASGPEFLLLDEPLASVDRPLRSRLVPFLKRIGDELGIPMLLVTHDPLEVLALARHVLVLENGRIVAGGAPEAVFASPAMLAALGAFAAENVFDVATTSVSEGLRHVVTRNGCTLEMAETPGFPAPHRVAVRAEDILLATEMPTRISAQNRLEGIVRMLEPRGSSVLVRIDSGGESWAARLTPRAVAELELAPGAPVHLVIKAHAIVPGPSG